MARIPECQRTGASGLALTAVLVLAALLALRQISAHDLGFHLEAGNWILDGNGWPANDTFTFTVNDRPYIDTSWGYQVVVAWIERMAGALGVVLLHVALVAAVLGVLARTTSIVAPGSGMLAPLLLVGGLAAEPRFEARPEVWSWLLLALTLDRLHRHAAGRPTALWPLIPLFAVWANSHSLFILGWSAMACFVAGLAIRDRRLDRRLSAWTVGAVAASLVNPYGWKAPLFAIGLGTRGQPSNPFAQTIGEFQSPLGLLISDELQFYVLPMLAWLLFVAAMIVSLPSLWRERRIPPLLLFAVFLFLSLSMVRNAPLLTVAALPPVVWGLTSVPALGRRSLRALQLAVVVVASVLALRVMTDAYYVDARRQQRFGLGWNRLVLPVDVSEWIARTRLEGQMLNHLNFGGYLMWAGPRPVFIDGRLEVMGERFFERYRAALASPTGLAAVAREYGIGWIVFPYRLAPDLAAGLSRHRGWRLAYVDHLAVVFVRDVPGAEALVDRSALEAESPATTRLEVARLPGLGETPRPGRLRRWAEGLVWRQRYPDRAFNLGVFHYARHEVRRAAGQFAAAVEQSRGVYYEVYNNLGASLAALGRPTAARDCYRLFLRELPSYRVQRRRQTRRMLDEVERAIADQGAVR